MRREMMMMGFDQPDEYGDQEGGYVVDDQSSGEEPQLTEEQLFAEQKKQFAAQLKQDLMYGSKKKVE